MVYARKPQVGEIYTATVINNCKFGLTVKLNDFLNNYEGLIHKTELTESLTEDSTVGKKIKVKIVAFSNDHISMTTRNVIQPNVMEPDIGEKYMCDGIYEEQKSRIRVASPERLYKSEYTFSDQQQKIYVKEKNPRFLEAASKFIPFKIPQEIKIYRNEDSFMSNIAKKGSLDQNASFSFTQSDFINSWSKPENECNIFKDIKGTVADIQKKLAEKMNIKQYRESLPIFKYREEIIRCVTNNQVVIIVAETGSGKTTQIPQYLAEGGFIKNGKIACIQPRRIAAVSVATRVSKEYGCLVGQDVGYKIRFDDHTGPSTIIKYMTDGILLRECMTEANLDKYSVIILDEAHERTRDTDVLFGLLKAAVQKRPSLRVIISSATLNAEKFSSFFNNAKIVEIPGSMFPVETFYYKYQVENYFNVALNTVLNIHMREPDGDILLFLTGQSEIELAFEILENYLTNNRTIFPLDLKIFEMYSALPSDKLNESLSSVPLGCRKLILATNIAEASITIDGIKFVIDPGYIKQKVNDPKTGLDNLIIVPISQASACQRQGRAGRTAPGKCYRLYSEKSFKEEMLSETVPEIQRSDLTSTVLYLKVIGIEDILNFDFMDPPKKDNILSSLKHLFFIGALDQDGHVTDLGRQISQLPIDAHLGRMLIQSHKLKCTDEISTIVAMLSIGNVFYRPRKDRQLANMRKSQFDHSAGDHFRLLNVFKKWEINNYSSDWCYLNFLDESKLWEALNIRKNLLCLMEKYDNTIYSAGLNYERIQMAIVSGFYQNVAMFSNVSNLKTYTTLNGEIAYIHPSSSLFRVLPKWIVFNSLITTRKKYMNELIVINPKWLQLFFPNLYEVRN